MLQKVVDFKNTFNLFQPVWNLRQLFGEHGLTFALQAVGTLDNLHLQSKLIQYWRQSLTD